MINCLNFGLACLAIGLLAGAMKDKIAFKVLFIVGLLSVTLSFWN